MLIALRARFVIGPTGRYNLTPLGGKEKPVPKRWTQRPPGSTWGDWGDDDELGRINLLTPGEGARGRARGRDGRSFCLSLPLDYPGGTALNQRRHPPEHRADRGHER